MWAFGSKEPLLLALEGGGSAAAAAVAAAAADSTAGSVAAALAKRICTAAQLRCQMLVGCGCMMAHTGAVRGSGGDSRFRFGSFVAEITVRDRRRRLVD
jgi:hypothetical protein